MDTQQQKVQQNGKTETDKKVVVPRTAAHLQRIKLEKLMKNPQKPAYVPEKPEEKLPGVFRPPEFIRNIWGSSAGAGSGDFHVYRGVRRREYARQKIEKQMGEKDKLDVQYHEKVGKNIKEAEERTSKKRAKRLKKKMKQKAKKMKMQKNKKKDSDEDSESEDENEENSNDQEDITENNKTKANSKDNNEDSNVNRKQDKDNSDSDSDCNES